ncbi:Fis family transcriptional regulator [Rhodocyclus tenuis]|uniref:SoxR reducing system RseC family protein n=1 Tax=Rhodocyclus gracilis TaxID=2929842 RepID=UPI001298C558|nr:SoxR reducing system RseC family protein [Rhodocyclus gracilis]MRD72852.1 Fis family transcriptional regulator [Rhodocyclus gracilis]
MVDASGTVTALDGDFALVQMDEGGCGRCHEPGGCGGGPNIGRMFCSAPRNFRALNPQRLSVGARVRVTIADGAVRRSALVAYAIPLLLFLAGAIGGAFLAGELASFAGAVFGLLAGWMLLRRNQRRGVLDAGMQPVIEPLSAGR